MNLNDVHYFERRYNSQVRPSQMTVRNPARNTSQDFEHRIEIKPIMTKSHEDAINEWCLKHVGRYGETWFTFYSEQSHKIVVCFINKQDAILFALRWL